MRFVFLFLCGVFFLFSCSTSKKTVKQHVLLDTLSVSANNNPMNIYRATTTRTWDITQTLVKLSFNMEQKTALGRVWIDAHPYNKSMDSIELDAKSMRIDSVGCINENGYFSLPYTYNDDKLVIHGYKLYSKRDTIHLYIQYVAMPYAASISGSNAIVEDRGLYFINSNNSIPKKPVQIWTQGETESNSHWLPTIDKPNERFTFQIELTVPDSFKTLSNGYLLSSIKYGNGKRIDSWVMDKPIQPYALMFTVGKYDIVKEYWHGKEISYYSESDYTPFVKLMFQHTTDILDYFSDITGVPYPWNKYSQVVVRDYVSGAMENTSASLFGEFMNQDNREVADDNNEDVVAHELFHQWFGDYVTAESWSNITLSESFADYSEYLWRKHQYGKEYADELLLGSLTSYLNQSQKNDPALGAFQVSTSTFQ
jgi:aminopeptidase N